MAPTVADYLLERLRAWDVRHVFAYAGDGINGILAAWGRAENKPQFIQARHEEMAAFEAVGYAKFTGQVGVCMATSGPGAIHLLNGLYDAKLDHVPVVAIVGQTNRSAMGGSYQQEVDLLSLFKDVASEYVQMVTVPEQLPNVLDRAIRIAMAERAPTAIIIPADVQELEYSAPTHAFKMVPSSIGTDWPVAAPHDEAILRAAEVLNAGTQGGYPRRAGRPRRAARARGGRRPARRRGGQAAAGQGRPLRRAAVRDRLDRAARHPAELRDDDELRHPADGRLELPLHPVPAGVRPGPRGPDRHRRQVHRDALPLRGQPRRRRRRHPARPDPAPQAPGRPVLARRHRSRGGALVAVHGRRGRGRSRPGQPDAAVPRAVHPAAGERHRRRRLRLVRELVRPPAEVPRRHARIAVGHPGHHGPGGAVRHRRQVRSPGAAGHRVRRRRRHADERPGRADHHQALLGAVGRPAADRRGAAQQRPQPGHLGNAGDGRRAEVRRIPATPRRRLRRVRPQPGPERDRRRRPGPARRGLGPGADRRPVPPSWTCAPTRPSRRSRRTPPSSRPRTPPPRCSRATPTAGACSRKASSPRPGKSSPASTNKERGPGI